MEKKEVRYFCITLCNSKNEKYIHGRSQSPYNTIKGMCIIYVHVSCRKLQVIRLSSCSSKQACKVSTFYSQVLGLPARAAK